MAPTFGAAPKCPTCDKAVYFAERVTGPAGKIYHKPCMKCVACGKVLDSGSVLDHDYEPYCRPCHGRSFGTRGYGVGHSGLVGEYRPSSPNVSPQRASTTASAPAIPARPRPSSPPVASVPRTPAFDLSPSPSPPPPPPPVPNMASRPSTASFTASGPPPPAKPPKLAFSNGSNSVSRSGSAAKIVSAAVGAGRDLCPRCKTVVYAAESVAALGCKWHKRCLRCSSCSTTLNGTNMVEKNGEPLCKRCHSAKSLSEQGMITRPGLF